MSNDKTTRSFLLFILPVQLCCLAMGTPNAVSQESKTGGNSNDSTNTVSDTPAKLLAAAEVYDVPTWNVSPASETQPAFRYEFWPHESRLKPGKAQLYYFRAVAALQQQDNASAKLLEITRKEDFATDETREFIDSMSPVLGNLQLLAFCEDVSWDRRRRESMRINLLEIGVDDLQVARDLVWLLVVRCEIQKADGDFDGFSNTILIGNRLAHLLGQGESIIQRSLAIAFLARMRIAIEEAIQTPRCPNFYWAIAAIPQPLVDARPATEMNFHAFRSVFPELWQAAAANWSKEVAAEKWGDCLARLPMLFGPQGIQQRWIKEAADYSRFVDDAIVRLLASGLPKTHLKKMPQPTIVMIDTANEMDRLADEVRKIAVLPREQRQLMQRLYEAGFRDAALFSDELEPNSPQVSAVSVFASSLLPSFRQLEAGADRTPIMQRRLMTLEAIRAFAAGNDGKLPESLTELTSLPAVNAFATEQPFGYTVESGKDGSIGILTGDIPFFPAANKLKFRIVID